MTKRIPPPIQLAVQAVVDKKGENFLVLDVREVCTMTDYFLIAEGHVPRHVSAISDYVAQVLKKEGIVPLHREGERDGEWVVLDYMNFMVHIFTPELRSFYALEELWKAGKVVSVPVIYGKE